MKILFVYPETPSTFWSFHDALKFVSKKSAEPPLGLITVASMLPAEWEKKLIDTNVDILRDRDIKWADYVFISAMNIHTRSFKEIIRRCNKLGVKVVAGGPLAELMTYVSFLDHFEDFTKGVLDTRHLIYYLSFIALFLVLAGRAVEAVRWKR